MLLVLTGCTNVENINIENEDSSMLSNSGELALDYNDAYSFENALNSGKKVKGKTVKFDVKAEDIIIGRVKEEPTSFLGSWEIKYDVIEIQHNKQESELEENTYDENTEVKEENNIENKTVEKIETTASTNLVNESKLNDETTQLTYNYYTTNDNETAKKGNTGKYSYVKRNGSYKVYWIIDFDDGYIYDFTEGNGDDSCEKIKLKSGDLNDGLEVSYNNSSNAWVKYIHFKYTNQPHQLVIVDNDYIEYEYSTTNLEDALELMKNKTIWEP